MPDSATTRSKTSGNPRPDENAPVSVWQSVLTSVFDFVRLHVWKGVAGVLTSAGVAGLLLSPVKDWAYHKLWQENPVLQCYVVQQEVWENDTFELDLTVVPQGIAVSSGIIDVQYPADKVSLIQPIGLLQIDPITDTKVAAKLVSRALTHGPASLDIHFSTKYGKYVASHIVLIHELDASHHPSRDNLTGTWNLRIGSLNGELHVEDDNGKISGKYELDNGDTGQLKGVRGPAAFDVSFISNHGERYSVACILNLSDSFIELKGDFVDPKTPKAKQPFYGSSHV